MEPYQARMAVRATKIHNRDELDRWRKRSGRMLRILFLSFLIGGSVFAIWGAIIGIINLHDDQDRPVSFTDYSRAVWMGLMTGFCCFGPLVVVACFVLFSSGKTEYKRLINELKQQQRVCEFCDAVALFEDKYVNPSKHKDHTSADLVPHMNVIEEEGRVNVLCDACYAEVVGTS